MIYEIYDMAIKSSFVDDLLGSGVRVTGVLEAIDYENNFMMISGSQHFLLIDGRCDCIDWYA